MRFTCQKGLTGPDKKNNIDEYLYLIDIAKYNQAQNNIGQTKA